MKNEVIDSALEPRHPICSQRIGHKRFDVEIQRSPTTRHCILCVDDEVAGTRMRCDLLEQEGYSVVLCNHPLEALRCDLSAFSLAIVDFEMPVINGRDLLLRLRALGARFPVVLLSGSVDDLSDDDRILFSRCISKGSPVQRLLDTLVEFLDSNKIPDFGA